MASILPAVMNPSCRREEARPELRSSRPATCGELNSASNHLLWSDLARPVDHVAASASPQGRLSGLNAPTYLIKARVCQATWPSGDTRKQSQQFPMSQAGETAFQEGRPRPPPSRPPARPQEHHHSPGQPPSAGGKTASGMDDNRLLFGEIHFFSSVKIGPPFRMTKIGLNHIWVCLRIELRTTDCHRLRGSLLHPQLCGPSLLESAHSFIMWN
ncbi:uncharacterized protein LOC118145793 isoform X2 [Callithrix jacchus]